MPKLKNAHALLIGVGSADLPETVTDANALYNILSNKEQGSYYKKNIKKLTGKKATRLGILKAFDDLLLHTNENSSVLLYYSGHGGMYSDNTFIKEESKKKPEAENQKYFHLCPNDYDPNNYENTWIKAEEIKLKISQLQSRRLIFFLDCCHAAGMTAGISSLNQLPRHTNADGLAQKLDDGRGMTIVSACRADQLSVILEGDSNSLFTKCMLDVLRGETKREGDEPFVRIFEIVQYIFKKVPEIYPQQNPYANLQIFEDFVVSFAPNLMAITADKTEIDPVDHSTQSIKKEPVTKFRETESATGAIIFVHGFSGVAENTFSQAPQLLMANAEMEGWDLFPLGYSGNVVPEMGKNIWACASDIKRNSDYLVTSIHNRFGRYNRLALIAHDLGGIVVQQALLQLEKNDLDRISHVLLFGTPSNGLPELELTHFFTYGNAKKDLSSGSPYITELRQRWNTTFNGGYPFVFKTVAATKDSYVPLASSLGPFATENQEIIEGDHFSMVAITETDDDAYRLILNTLRNKSFLNISTDKEEIHLALGKYTEVVNSLFPKLKTLDSKGLEQLVYALEGTGREAEAVRILREHPQASQNSNLLGIIGGRYKRLYLSTFSADNLQMAIKYYSQALEISESKEDVSQIYYHAINLAFLSLMNSDRSQMTHFATRAYQATKRDSFNSLWKLATIAESYIYKGNFDKAKIYYEKAAEMAGIREKISIYTNAYNAFKTLMGTENPNDDFIKFLKNKFLT